MELFYKILGIGLAVIVIVLIGVIIYFRYIRQPTREKFAFYGTATIVVLATSVIAILSDNSIVNLLINTVNSVLHQQIKLVKIELSEKVLIVIVFLVIAHVILEMHKNWNSPQKSEREVENTRQNKPISIVEDSVLFIKLDEKLQVYNPDNKQVTYNLLGEVNHEKMPWYENVSEILPMISNQYHIDIDNHWHSEHKCFLSEYGNNKIAIFCPLTEPTDSDIDKVLAFIDTQKVKVSRLIIAIDEHEKNTIPEKQEYTKDGTNIEIRYKQEMLDKLVDFTPYYRYLKNSFYKNEVSQGTEKTLEDIYVPLSGHLEKDETSIKSVESFILEWTKDDSVNKHLAVLGDYGQGKSVLSLKLAIDMISQHSPRIPILLELRGKSPRNLSMQEILATWATHYRLEGSAILKLHYEGRLLIIFEGFDEMDLVGDSEMRLNHFRNLWEFAKSPKAKILITGRPNFFLDDIELKESLGIQQTITADVPHCQALYLNSLSREQIEQALRHTEPDTKASILQTIENQQDEDNRFYDLVSRPATLFLISSIWKQAEFDKRKDKINSATVIRAFIHSAYERQVAKSNDTPLTVKEREYFMMGVAVGMMNLTGYSNQISSEQLNELILKLYEHFPEDLTGTHSAFEKNSKPLKQRFQDDEKLARESILTDVRSCGILVKDVARNNYFKFAHKSFLECLISEYYVISLLNNERSFIYFSINKSIPTSMKNTKETTGFIIELLSSYYTENSQQSDIFLSETIFKSLFEIKMIPVKYSSLFCYYFTTSIAPILYSLIIFSVFYEHLFFFIQIQPENEFKVIIMIALLLLGYFYFYIFIKLNLGGYTFYKIEKLFYKIDKLAPKLKIDITFNKNNIFMKPLIMLISLSEKRIDRKLEINNDYKMSKRRIDFITKSKIWYQTCKEIGIDDDTLKKVVYSKYLNEVKNDFEIDKKKNSNQLTEN